MNKKLFVLLFLALVSISLVLPFTSLFSPALANQPAVNSLPPSDRGFNPKGPVENIYADTIPRSLTIDWNWIIPALVIVVGYFSWRFIQLESKQFYGPESYIGTKGGKSKKKVTKSKPKSKK